MQNNFFIKPFREAGIEVCRPSENNQSIIHQKIVDELENGIVKKETKQQLMTIINKMVQKDHPNISVRTLIGFKTNQGQDRGRDYFKITKREDYVAKMTIL